MKTIVVAVITACLVLIFGIVWTFGLVVAMNGFQQAKATRVFIGYFGLLGICVLLAGFISHWGVKKLLLVTAWKLWLAAPVTILGISVLAGGVLVLGSILLMAILGQ